MQYWSQLTHWKDKTLIVINFRWTKNVRYFSKQSQVCFTQKKSQNQKSTKKSWTISNVNSFTHQILRNKNLHSQIYPKSTNFWISEFMNFPQNSLWHWQMISHEKIK